MGRAAPAGVRLGQRCPSREERAAGCDPALDGIARRCYQKGDLTQAWFVPLFQLVYIYMNSAFGGAAAQSSETEIRVSVHVESRLQQPPIRQAQGLKSMNQLRGPSRLQTKFEPACHR